MESRQFRREEEKKQRRREQEQTLDDAASSPSRCPSCGATVETGDKFCGECGAPLGQASSPQVRYAQEHARRHAHGRQCPHCHKSINDTCELCPHCGRPVSSDHCTFCGAPFEGHEAFCGECGSPRGGIICPQCGTLGFRSFCAHCNAPLNDAAAQAIAQAQKDPNYQRATALAAEMAQMEEYLEAMAAEIEQALADDEAEAGAPDAPGLSNEGQTLQSRYAAIMRQLGQRAVDAPASKPAPAQPSRREKLRLKFHDAKRILDAYQARAAEMDAALRAMVPPPGMTPQQQRDFVSARKVCVTTTEKRKVPQYWICNFCGCQHSQPSECAEPQLGGVWTYQTVTVSRRVWQYME